MSGKNKKDRRKVLARRNRPRPGQKTTRLSAYNVSVSDAAAGLLDAEALRAYVQAHFDLIEGTDPSYLATTNFRHDGRLFAIQTMRLADGQQIVSVSLDHEKVQG